MHRVFDVRWFTALDMFGTAGTPLRRRIIVAEFMLACPAVFVVAVLVLRTGHPLFGGCLLGVALNYLPLAVHALSLFPPGRLEAELAGLNVEDLRRQLRGATLAQLMLLVPFLVAALAVVQVLTSGPDRDQRR